MMGVRHLYQCSRAGSRLLRDTKVSYGLGARRAEPELPTTAVVCADAPHRFDDGANLPDCAGRHRGQHLRPKVPELGVGSGDILALARCYPRAAASTTARVVHRRAAGCPPRVELCPVVRASDAGACAVAVVGPVERIVHCRTLAAVAPVNMVRVRADRFVVDHAAVALFAANRAPNRHPEAGLPRVAHLRPVSACAGCSIDGPQIRLPDIGGFPACPPRVLAVDGLQRSERPSRLVVCVCAVVKRVAGDDQRVLHFAV